MNTIIVPGYGDGQNYIDRITQHWPEKYGLNPQVIPFGTNDLTSDYEEKWTAFETKLRDFGKTAIIGISFGVTIALRAMQDYPDLVSSAVCISGPHDIRDVDQPTIKRKYPLLNESLRAFSIDNLPVEKVMTIRPRYDSVIDPDKVAIRDATNLRVPIAGHATGIAWALKFKAGDIAKFIKDTTQG